MKKRIIPLVLLSLSLLCGCTDRSSPAKEGEAQEVVQAAVSDEHLNNLWKDFAKKTEKGDVTSFLVGEFYVSNGYTAYFDGRGSVTMIAPDDTHVAGTYSMKQKNGKNATVTVDLGQGSQDYAYALISSDGGFTLTDSADNLLVFVLKTYD